MVCPATVAVPGEVASLPQVNVAGEVTVMVTVLGPAFGAGESVIKCFLINTINEMPGVCVLQDAP